VCCGAIYLQWFITASWHHQKSNRPDLKLYEMTFLMVCLPSARTPLFHGNGYFLGVVLYAAHQKFLKNLCDVQWSHSSVQADRDICRQS
jgi:hypothetical protein